MRKLRLNGSDVAFDAPEMRALLAKSHTQQERPVCLCCPSGVPMYVAHIADRYVLKRMPGTGPRHDSRCDSYEPPYELSGFGHVNGAAIQEKAQDGTTLLKLDFSLSKSPGRAPSAPGEGDDTSTVRTDGTKLSLRALLHYLWDQAEFNRWRPAMAGRRNWAVLRKFLLEAAEGKTAKGRPLADVLYIPEMFNSERETEIVQRRTAFLQRVLRGEGRRQPLALLIGEVKEIAAARFGHRLIVKHAPRFPFMLNEDVHRRMNAKFATELALWNANSECHLVAIATFGLDLAGIASIETIAVMVTTENWIPFESTYEATLLDVLTHRRTNFLKGLRYNLPSAQPLASVVLREDGASPVAMPVAMYVVPARADTAYRAALSMLIEESGLAHWVWDAADAMPPLPF